MSLLTVTVDYNCRVCTISVIRSVVYANSAKCWFHWDKCCLWIKGEQKKRQFIGMWQLRIASQLCSGVQCHQWHVVDHLILTIDSFIGSPTSERETHTTRLAIGVDLVDVSVSHNTLVGSTCFWCTGDGSVWIMLMMLVPMRIVVVVGDGSGVCAVRDDSFLREREKKKKKPRRR